jgi:hypothetical protein
LPIALNLFYRGGGLILKERELEIPKQSNTEIERGAFQVEIRKKHLSAVGWNGHRQISTVPTCCPTPLQLLLFYVKFLSFFFNGKVAIVWLAYPQINLWLAGLCPTSLTTNNKINLLISENHLHSYEFEIFIQKYRDKIILDLILRR